MARYIDADALHARLDYCVKEGMGSTIAFSFRHIIDETPTADVRENVHGNWVGIDDEPCETFECDKCGFVLDDWIQGALYNFCPNCGCSMKEGKDAPGD